MPYEMNCPRGHRLHVWASILLALGLLIVSWSAQGPERWVSLVMLTIIIFSIYVGGVAWLAIPARL